MIIRAWFKECTHQPVNGQSYFGDGKVSLKIENKYYATMLREMDSEMQEFYISGIYFRENADIYKFLKYIIETTAIPL